MPEIDIPYFMLSMNDVLYDPKTGDIFMPNMNQFANVKDPSKYPQTGNQNVQDVTPAAGDDVIDDDESDIDNKEDEEDESNDKS